MGMRPKTLKFKHLSILIGVLVIVASIFLVRSTLQEYGRRNGLYWYDVEKSYEYGFEALPRR